MKKTLIVAAVAALAAGGALAQSSVTIYGRFNLSAESQKNLAVAGTQKVEQNSSSRIGFKGTEDLGGGMKAGFQLEHGFSPDTGLPNAAFWGRRSEVNLSGAFGTLRMGTFTSEAYYATADYISMHNHDTGTSSDALYAYIGRNTNKIGYRLPELVKGLTLESAVSAGEGGGRSRTWDLAANYGAGPLQLGFGYEKNGDANQFGVRGLYEMGAFVFGAYVQKDENGYGAKFGNRTTYRLSGMYTMGPSEFHVNFGSAGKYSNVADSAAKQYTFAYNYNLSKRTKVYAFYTTVKNGTGVTYLGAGKGLDMSSIAAGIRHNF